MYHSGNQMIDPEVLFEKAQLRPGMHAADLGCGKTGHVVFPGAAILGEMGVMYAVDILKEVLLEIKKRAAIESLINVQTVWSDLERVDGTKIPARSLDVAFIINMLFQAKNHLAVLDGALRLLKDKARLLVVDWRNNNLPFAPPAEKLINFDEIKKWARSKGLAVQEEFDMGGYHHGVVLYKQS